MFFGTQYKNDAFAFHAFHRSFVVSSGLGLLQVFC